MGRTCTFKLNELHFGGAAVGAVELMAMDDAMRQQSGMSMFDEIRGLRHFLVLLIWGIFAFSHSVY